MSCQKHTFKSHVSSEKMTKAECWWRKGGEVVKYNQAVCKEEHLFSKKRLFSTIDIFLSVFVYCSGSKLILFVFIRFSFNCIFLSLLFLSPELLHPESSSVDPDMQVKHDLFFYRWSVRVYMQVCLFAVYQCSGVSDVKMLVFGGYPPPVCGYRWELTGYYIVWCSLLIVKPVLSPKAALKCFHLCACWCV